MIKCNICNREFESLLSYSSHIRNYHKMKVKDFYDKYFKEENEGICPTCGKETTFINPIKGYRKFCSSKCANNSKEVREKIKQTNLKKYGCEYGFQCDEIKDKIKNTCLERYGVSTYLETQEVKDKIQSKESKKKREETNIERYGYRYAFQNKEIRGKITQSFLDNNGYTSNFCREDVKLKKEETLKSKYGGNSLSEALSNMYADTKEKRIKSNIEKYGVEYPIQNDEIKDKAKKSCIDIYGGLGNASNYIKNKYINTCLERYGVNYYVSCAKNRNRLLEKDINEKRNKTKREHGTFNTSMNEDRVYEYLIDKFSKDDIERNYKSDNYLFNCDFYVKSLDLYIECNFHWTHGFHWFDKNSKNDIDKLNSWKEKSKKSKFYENAISTWTVGDVKKREAARENNLNYVVLWNEEDIDLWFSLGCPIGKDWKEEYTWKD